jgi:hypothetical protein
VKQINTVQLQEAIRKLPLIPKSGDIHIVRSIPRLDSLNLNDALVSEIPTYNFTDLKFIAVQYRNRIKGKWHEWELIIE